MKNSAYISPWMIFALVATMMSVRNRGSACDAPSPQAGAEQTELTPEEVEDSYEIYSILLPIEVPREWKIAEWAIRQQTQTFPNIGGVHSVRQCLAVPRDQATIYLPVIDDYVAKNNRKRILERKFGLPQYELVDSERSLERASITPAVRVMFEVSAVGFDKERTRALVYVGHHCGSLCGGGSYHLLVKKAGKWQVDREFRGMSCLWAS